jgi:tetratricopeptide (TPR) repeat protein
MSLKFACVITTAAIISFAATPSFAISPPQVVFNGAENSVHECSIAAIAAQDRGAGTDGDLAACDMAVRLSKDDRSHLAVALTNRSVIHLMRKEYDATIADTTVALGWDNKLPEALVNRGVAQMLAGRPKEAVIDLTAGLNLGPANLERVYFNRAMAREDSGDLVGAYLDYRKASELAPSWDRPKQELARFTVVQKRPIS